jgi:hypothetical protein
MCGREPEVSSETCELCSDRTVAKQRCDRPWCKPDTVVLNAALLVKVQTIYAVLQVPLDRARPKLDDTSV